MQSLLARIETVDVRTTFEQLSDAKTTLTGLLDEVAPQLESAASILPLVPDLLGASGPRTYVLMFMNSAEVRALGGTGLSFTALTADGGRLSIGQAVPAGFGNFPEYLPGQVVPIPDGAEALYQHGTFGTFIPNATMRPDFATAGEIVSKMWTENIGGEVDAVIGIDPTALSYAMEGLEPVQISTGDLVTSETVVPLLLNEVYQRYWSGNVGHDNVMQDLVYAEVVGAVSERITTGQFEPTALLAGLGQAATERRLLLWSANEAEQAAFGTLGVDGAMPMSDNQTDRVGVYFQDDVGSKMSYYLHTAATLEKASCRDDGRQTYRVSVDLSNALPTNAARTISPSILGTFKRSGLEPGVQRNMIFVLAPPGAEIVRATVDGAEIPLEGWHDEEYPAARFVVTTPPQASTTVTVEMIAPEAGEKDLAAEITPMINPTTVTEGVLDCATVKE
ncbi:MAG: DUF4012 domain-containing protein [Microbacteriaceae bacterium]